MPNQDWVQEMGVVNRREGWEVGGGEVKWGEHGKCALMEKTYLVSPTPSIFILYKFWANSCNQDKSLYFPFQTQCIPYLPF